MRAVRETFWRHTPAGSTACMASSSALCPHSRSTWTAAGSSPSLCPAPHVAAWCIAATVAGQGPRPQLQEPAAPACGWLAPPVAAGGGGPGLCFRAAPPPAAPAAAPNQPSKQEQPPAPLPLTHAPASARGGSRSRGTRNSRSPCGQGAASSCTPPVLPVWWGASDAEL